MEKAEIQSNLKKRLFKFCDKVNDMSCVIAVKRAFICIMPILIVSTLTGIILETPNPAYQAWLNHFHSLRRNEILSLLSDIKSGSRLLQGVIFCAAISHYYMVELKPRLSTAQWVVCPVALVAYGTFLSSEIINDVSLLGYSNKLIAMLVGLYVAKAFVFVLDHISGCWSSKKVINIDPLWNGVIEYGPPSIIAGFSAAVWNRLMVSLFHASPSQIIQNICSSGYDFLPFGRHVMAVIYFLENALFTFIGLDVRHLTTYVNKRFFYLHENEFITEPLLQLCRGMGGYGLAIPLFFAVILVSNSYRRRWVAKISVPFIISNFPEVILYGIPVIFNPIFVFPMILLPILNLEIFIIAHKLGIVPIATMTPLAISPFPIYAFVMTHSVAMSWVAIFAAFIDTIILMPFVKLMDEYDLYVFAKEINNLEKAYKKCEAEERVSDENLLSASLLRTMDTLSDIFRRVLKRNVPKRFGDIFFEYQPQMNRDSKFVGAEVLIRWNPLSKVSNEKDTIYPPLIIYLAYRIGMLKDIDHIIIDNAVAELMYLKENGHGQVKLDINLSISSITPALCEYINDRMSLAGIERNRLWITITQNDNIPVKATPENMECMLNLKNSGYVVGVDGFDAGAIAFDYLREGFFNSITIGQKITKELSLKGMKANKYIVNMLIDYGQENDTYITANFLEDDSYMVKLAGMGVDFFQGEVLVPPLPVAKFNDFMDIEEKKGLLAYYKDEVI